MNTSGSVVIASAGSTLFGARAAVEHLVTVGGSPVSVITDHGHLLFAQASDGTLAADVVMLPSDMIEALSRAGRLFPAERVALGSVNIAAAVCKGSSEVDVRTVERLSRAFMEAREIVLTLAPTGEHMMGVINDLGLMSAVSDKIRRFDKSIEVNAYLASAEYGALAFGPATEIRAWADRGIQHCAAIPDELQVVLPYAAAILSATGNSSAAIQFLDYLRSAESRAQFAATGVMPNT